MKTLEIGVLALVLGSGLTGCRNLELPSQGADGDGGVLLVGGTEAVLLAPDPATMQLPVATVRVRLSDVNGLRGATLGCGDVVLASWLAGGEQAREFERRVDLLACRPEGLEEGVAPVDLVVQSVDGTGVQQLHGPYRLQVQYPARGTESFPVELAVEHPPRVAPHAPVGVRVRASAPLAGPPHVTVDGEVAGVRGVPGDAGTSLEWVAELPAGLPLVRPTADSPPDITVAERTVAVRVLAQSTTGSASQALSSLAVSHVLWERALPFGVFTAASGQWVENPWTLRPVATDAGLHLAAERLDDWGGSTWFPARLAPETGVPQFLPPETAGAEWQPWAMDGQGRLLLLRKESGVAMRVDFGAGPDAGTAVPTGMALSGLRRVGDRLCRADTLAPPVTDGGSCPTDTPSEHLLSCLEEGGTLSKTRVPGSVGALDVPHYQAGSGGTFLGVEFSYDTSCCVDCPGAGVIGMPPQLTYVRDLRVPASEGFDRFIPDRGGSFAVVLQKQFAAAAVGPSRSLGESVSRVFFLHADGGVSPEVGAAAGIGAEQVLGAAPGNILVTLSSSTQGTRVAGWRAGETIPVWERELPGSLVASYDAPWEGEYEDTSLFDADGSGVALLKTFSSSSSGATLWVVGFGPGLAPRWAYRYPLSTQDAKLYPAPDGRRVYLVDAQNAAVTALVR